MPTAVLLHNSTVASWQRIGGLVRQTIESHGFTVVEAPLPTTPEERAALRAAHPGAVFFHNCVPSPGVPLANPACVPDVRWRYLGYRSDVIPGATNILLPWYEFGALPQPWVALYNRYDAIWVCSRHVAEVLRSSGVTSPIVKLPPPLDRVVAPIKTSYAPTGRPFRFLFVGEPHFRKGVHYLMYGFDKAFPQLGQAELIIKTAPSKDWAPLREDIQIITDTLSPQAMDDLYLSADCYISSSLAEGLGLPIFEAAMRGVPLAVNNWGGHRDLVTSGGYFRIPHRLSDRPYTGSPQFYTPGQTCAVSDESAVARTMLTVFHSSPAKRQRMAARARAYAISQYGASALDPQWASQLDKVFAAQK